MFPNLSIDQQRFVVDEVMRFVGSSVAKGQRSKRASGSELAKGG
jgi:hypothetical protein